MSYTSLAQAEDAASESDYSEIRAYSGQHEALPASSSPNFDMQSIASDTSARLRTVSRDGSGPMQCPTPDLQSLQGAYLNNIERLEQSAERLSSGSDIGLEIKKMRDEQKRSDSRRSSILHSPAVERTGSPILHRQLSYGYGSHASHSILGTNTVARSGGFSPAAYFASPRSSVKSGSWSHQSSIRGKSEPRLTHVAEPEQEGKPLDSPMSTRFTPAIPAPEPIDKVLRVRNSGAYNLDDVAIPHSESPEPDTSNPILDLDDTTQEPRPSTDTARQADGLFSDFDGVHTTAPTVEAPPQDEHSRRSSTGHLLGGRPKSVLDPMPEEGMVYYPAPVPMMLNLPERLSKMPVPVQRDKRRSEMLGDSTTDARKSAIWLPESRETSEEHQSIHEADRPPIAAEKHRSTAKLPPQLRASMFFDYPAAGQEVEVKGESAVATLDSILDASAFAPVSAFTDHPIVGQAGANIYARAPIPPRRNPPSDPRNRNSTATLLTKRSSKADMLQDDGTKRNSLMSIGNYFGRRKSSGHQLEDLVQDQDNAPDALNEAKTPLRGSIEAPLDDRDEFIANQEDLEEAREEEDLDRANAQEQPTTLLAELQMRKAQQKLRNRQAATAFPDGMHSTLLQLDAVAQVEKQTRQKKHTKLAWEEPNELQAGQRSEDDEDVPLGMLYAGNRANERRHEDNQPLGLIARRQYEDNEPLSFRRARLRGEEPSIRTSSFALQNPQDGPKPTELIDEDADDHPGETLAERIRRIRATQIPNSQTRPMSGDFASEVMSVFGVPSPNEQLPHQPAVQAASSTRNPSKTPDHLAEETLGQRRRRLQSEAAASRNLSHGSNTSHNTPQKPNTSIATMHIRPAGLPQSHSMADILSAHPLSPTTANMGIRSISNGNELKFAPAPQTRNTSWAMQVSQQQQRQAGAANDAAVRMNSGSGAGGAMLPHPMVAGRRRERSGGEENEFGRKGDMIDRWRQSVMY